MQQCSIAAGAAADEDDEGDSRMMSRGGYSAKESTEKPLLLA
jgi:hypothetical protein